MTYYIQTTRSFISPQERARLVRLCATIIGNSEAAEDLAQETLLEAWRHLEGPSDQEETCSESVFPDPYDLEIELEHKELIALLDRALAALPPETRIALVQHYIDESPLAEIARQLGTNASAIAMRLQRGKLVLRRVLTTQMQDEFSPYGFSLPKRSAWETTRLWCELCGQHHLLGRLDPENGSLELKCPSCCRDAGVVFVEARYPALLRGVNGYKRALSRLATWEPTYYRMGIKRGSAPCITCGELMRLHRFHPSSAPSWSSNGEIRRAFGSEQRHSVAFICEVCDTFCLALSNGIARWEPVTQQFLRKHSRVRTLPERAIEVDGRPAIVTSLESLTDNARLDLILDLETCETVRVSGDQA
jgi:RNA polymerase sigma-70 factor (ECF subfamily)